LPLVGTILALWDHSSTFVLVRLVRVFTERGSVSQLMLENAVLRDQVKIPEHKMQNPGHDGLRRPDSRLL
jgi:hypothetical protein